MIIGPRDQGILPRIVGRTWNDAARELQEFLSRVDGAITTLNEVIRQLGGDGSSTSTTIQGTDSKRRRHFLHMGS